jgi:uncharacterized secreted protein with C-terminal beta-propeller domain
MRIWIRAGALLVATVVLVSIASSTGRERHASIGPAPGGAASGVELVAYTSCADMIAGLRRQTAKNVGPYGIGQPGGPIFAADGRFAPAAPYAAGGESKAAQAAPEHSTTNDHEAGADEPDLIKSDGNRVVTVENGVLRVVDAASRKVTGSLKLTDSEQPWGTSDLLVQGDRALVILNQAAVEAMQAPGSGRPFTSATKYVLVDLSGQPKVLGSLTPNGSYVDARLVGSTVRLVVRSQPDIAFPQWTGRGTQRDQLARNRAAVRKAPLGAWLPRYQVIGANGSASTRSVPCERVSHPVDYTGTSMLTVYSVDLAKGLDDTSPISLAADGDTVYATTSSLYVTSNPRWWITPMVGLPMAPDQGVAVSPTVPKLPKPPAEQTEIHRFNITGAGAPRYVASGKVAGRLLNQYSLSDYDGYLRVATTSGNAIADEPGGQSSASSTSTSSVYVLRADTLAKVGEVDGLGKRQRIYSVRFIGPVGYVVTFQQMDPLYTLDLRDPTAPRVAGQLELTGYSAYLHPAADGRLIGIGQEATTHGRPTGLQVSLFDVSDPAHPRRQARLVQPDDASGAETDPHAFLYWPKSGLAVLPVSGWSSGQPSPGALVLHISDSGIVVKGTITHPSPATDPYRAGVTRALVIGDDLWTLSGSGLMVSDAASLDRQAWVSLTS